MSENKSIDNPQIKIINYIGTRAQDEKLHWNTTKTNNGCSFQYTKFSVIDLVLANRKNLSGVRPKLVCVKSSSCWFSFSAARMPLPKLPLLGKFENHCLWAIQIFSVLAAIMVKASPFIRQSKQVAWKASDLYLLYGLFHFSYTSQEPLTSSPKTHFPKGSGQVYNSSPKHKIRPSLFSEEEVSCYYHRPSCKLSMDW